MKKLLASLMIILLSVNTFAANVEQKQAELKKAYTRLDVRLATEWDQESEKKKQEIVAEFQAKIDELKAQGLKGQDLVKFVKSNILDKNVASDFEKLVASAGKDISVEEAQVLVGRYVAETQATGANYRARVVWGISGGVAAVIVLAVVLAVLLTSDVVYVNDPYDPYPYDTCYWGWGYDYWGNYVYDCWYY